MEELVYSQAEQERHCLALLPMARLEEAGADSLPLEDMQLMSVAGTVDLEAAVEEQLPAIT
jgi:hypothetical protein